MAATWIGVFLLVCATASALVHTRKAPREAGQAFSLAHDPEGHAGDEARCQWALDRGNPFDSEKKRCKTCLAQDGCQYCTDGAKVNAAIKCMPIEGGYRLSSRCTGTWQKTKEECKAIPKIGEFE